MKTFFKILLKIFILLLILAVILCGVGFYIGYSYYQEAISEKPLSDRVGEYTEAQNYVEYEDLSELYIDAVISIEDHRYFEHGPIDPISIMRALFNNITTGTFDEGGSTITQQVAKNVVFTQEQTISRKLGEIFAAYDLEKNYSKEEIFALYVNSSYFGEGYYGIYDASYGYYNKSPKDLTLDEASMLAGVPNAPSIYAPTVNPDLAEQRQQQVLDRMVECGYITENEANLI